MSSILSILNELAADNSRLAKEAILAREKNNALLKEVFRLALEPKINFWLFKIPEYTIDKPTMLTLEKALPKLNKLIEREVTGNDAIKYLSLLLSELQPDDATVVERIIQRDLRCGVSDATVNKVWGKGFISEFPVMLAYKDCSGITFPAICQEKYDGVRCLLTWNGKEAIAMSRNGKFIETFGVFNSTMQEMGVPEGTTFDGELLCRTKDGFLDRKTGNGIVSKGIRGTISKKEAELLTLVSWDIVDEAGTLKYTQRLNLLLQYMGILFDKQFDTRVLVAETKLVKDMEEAQVMFNQYLAEGKEGIILKNTNATWEAGRPRTAMGKLKAENTCSLKIVDWVEGTGKYASMLGALVVESADGKVRVNIGSGFTDDERKAMTKKNTVGKIAEVMYNMRIKDKNSSTESLFLPRFLEIRADKTEADNEKAIV